MTILIYLNFFASLFYSTGTPAQQRGICEVYGNVYVETQSRNRADFSVYVNKEDTFSDVKVYVHENQFYADRPGNWFFVKERELADFVIYIEKEKGLAKYNIFYTPNDFEAGCR